MKRAVCFLLTVLMAVSFASCNLSSNLSAPPAPSTITYSQFDDEIKPDIYSKVYELINYGGIIDSVYKWDYPSKFEKEREKAFEQLRIIDNLYKEADRKTIYSDLDGMIPVKVSNKALIRTLDYGDYCYYGNLKNEKPNGLGMIFKGYPFPIFIGYFKNGVPSGYGMFLNSMGGIRWESEDVSFDGKNFFANGYSIFYYHDVLNNSNKAVDAASSAARYTCMDHFSSELTMAFNYLSDAENSLVEKYYGSVSRFVRSEHLVFRPSVEYEGTMKKSERSGKGNHYLDTFVLDNNASPLSITLPYGIACYGPLDYSGDYHSDTVTGEGTIYYPDGCIKYIGELKKGKPHGKGVLYNPDGTVNYKGKFKNGDIS